MWLVGAGPARGVAVPSTGLRTILIMSQLPLLLIVSRVHGGGAPEYVPGEIDAMEFEVGEHLPGKSAAKSAPNATGKKPEQSQQLGPGQVEPYTKSKVQPMVDWDGYLLVTKEKRPKRRRSHPGKSNEDGAIS